MDSGDSDPAQGNDARKTRFELEDDRGSILADIADAAGVSISTVSRALRGSGGVSKATQKRVLDLAQNLDYRVRGKSAGPQQFQLVVSMRPYEAGPSGFYSQIIEAIELAVDAAGIPITITFFEKGIDNAEKIRAHGRDDCRTGFLLLAIDDEEILQAASETGQVLLVNSVDQQMRFDAVMPANRLGGYLATRHLLELGHRRIAHVTSMTRPTIRDRHAGYRLALSDYGIPFDPELLFEVPSMRPSNGVQVARQALEEGRLDATGIFCSNDMLAVGVASAIDSAGFSVPEDFSIVGFDNTRVTARHRPSLTTLGVDLTEIGRQSVRRLLEHMNDPDLPPVEIQIGCNLIVRESSGPPRSRPRTRSQ